MSNKTNESSEPQPEGPETAAETSDAQSTPTSEAVGAAAAAEPPSPETIAEWKTRAAECDAMKDRYLRSVADLENFRKRAARERQEAVHYASQALLTKLMPALDNLDMALAAVSTAQGASMESLKTGVEMVLGQLKTILREAGLEEIDATGQVFDPAWHEAVSQQETTEAPEGSVVQQLRKGYRLHQRLLRPASVVVARPPQG